MSRMWLRNNLGRCGAVVAVIALVATPTAVASAQPSGRGCVEPVVMVHDIASTESEWDGWVDELSAAGECAEAVTYGRSELTGPTQGLAGFARIEDSAAEIAHAVDAVRARTGADRVRILARGAGGLVAQYAAAHPPVPGVQPIAALVTIGPLWGGTNLAGLGTVAAINRSLGVYDALRAVEKPLVDPYCGACGQLVTGSDLLVALDRAGLPTPGVRYANVISLGDGLMTDPAAAAVPGMDSVIVSDAAPRHDRLPYDPVVRRHALNLLHHP